MSFASDTKSELVSIKADNCCTLAELSALLRLHGEINLSSDGLRIEFFTTNLQIARRVIKSIKDSYHIDVDIVFGSA